MGSFWRSLHLQSNCSSSDEEILGTAAPALVKLAEKLVSLFHLIPPRSKGHISALGLKKFENDYLSKLPSKTQLFSKLEACIRTFFNQALKSPLYVLQGFLPSISPCKRDVPLCVLTFPQYAFRCSNEVHEKNAKYLSLITQTEKYATLVLCLSR